MVNWTRINPRGECPYLLKTTPEVIFTFDDGMESVYSLAFPAMRARGIPGVAYITTDWIGTTGFMSSEQLVELINAGWDISNHTMSHPGLDLLTKEEQRAELVGARTVLQNIGAGDAANHIAYPFGRSNADTHAVMTEEGFKTGRESGTGRFDLPCNWFLLDCDAATTLPTMLSFLDDVKARNKTLIFMFHGLAVDGDDALSYTPDSFEAILDYVIAQRILPLTITQLYECGQHTIHVPIPW